MYVCPCHCLCMCVRACFEVRGWGGEGAHARLSSAGHLGLTNRLPTFMEQRFMYISIRELLTTNRPVMILASSGSVRTACGLPDARRSARFLGACRSPKEPTQVLWVSTEAAVLPTVSDGNGFSVTCSSQTL